MEGEIEWEITSLTEFSGYTQSLKKKKTKALVHVHLFLCVYNKDCMKHTLRNLDILLLLL